MNMYTEELVLSETRQDNFPQITLAVVKLSSSLVVLEQLDGGNIRVINSPDEDAESCTVASVAWNDSFTKQRRLFT